MKALRIGLCAVAAFAVAAHGAVEVWSESALWMAAAVLALVWVYTLLRDEHPEVRWNPLLVPVGVLVVLAAVQWLAGLSAYPYLTRMAALRGLALWVLLFLFVQAFRTRRQFIGLAWFLLIVAFLASVQGILQHHTFNGKLYWVRELTSGGIPFGPYVNRNHFAGLIELIAPLGLALLVLRGLRRELLPLAGLLTVIPIGALFLSASRGGIVSFAVQVVLLLLVVWTRPAGGRRLLPVVGVLLAAGAFLMWLDVGRAFDRFVGSSAGDVTRSRRVGMVRDTWRIFLDHPVAGAGFGTLVAVYPRYETLYDGKVVEHAHNDYVQTLAEGGTLGGGLALTFLAMFLWGGLKKLEQESDTACAAVRVGAMVGCCGLLVHGLVDFNLQIPSHIFIFLMLTLVSVTGFEILKPATWKGNAGHPTGPVLWP